MTGKDVFDAMAEVITVEPDGTHRVDRFEDKGALKPHDTPGVCFAVSPDDLDATLTIIQGVFAGSNALENERRGPGIHRAEEVYTLTSDEGELKLVVPRDDERSLIKEISKALHVHGTICVPASLAITRSEEELPMIRYESFSLEHYYPDASTYEEEIIDNAKRLGLYDRQKLCAGDVPRLEAPVRALDCE